MDVSSGSFLPGAVGGGNPVGGLLDGGEQWLWIEWIRRRMDGITGGCFVDDGDPVIWTEGRDGQMGDGLAASPACPGRCDGGGG